jgi:hypothetical protein
VAQGQANELFEDDAGNPALPPAKARPAQEVLVDDEGMPEWARGLVPPELKIPMGKKLTFLRFPSDWTDAPERGVPSLFRKKMITNDEGKLTEVKELEKPEERLCRVLVMWPINLAEERLAAGKAGDGSAGRLQHELAKMMLRAVDGMVVDRGGNWAKDDTLISCDQVWSDLGPKCRPMVIAHYNKLHRLGDADLADFFINCVAVASASAG